MPSLLGDEDKIAGAISQGRNAVNPYHCLRDVSRHLCIGSPENLLCYPQMFGRDLQQFIGLSLLVVYSYEQEVTPFLDLVSLNLFSSNKPKLGVPARNDKN